MLWSTATPSTTVARFAATALLAMPLLLIPILYTPSLLDMPIPYVGSVGAHAPAWWVLFAHGCAGALGGVAALFGDSALSATLGGADKHMSQSITMTAVTKAVNSMTYAYLKQTTSWLGSATLGTGSIMVAAAGTGIVAAMMQGVVRGALAGAGRTSLHPQTFLPEMVKSVLAFEAFWLTYSAICALSPAQFTVRIENISLSIFVSPASALSIL
jgi:hypothetical protein